MTEPCANPIGDLCGSLIQDKIEAGIKWPGATWESAKSCCGSEGYWYWRGTLPNGCTIDLDGTNAELRAPSGKTIQSGLCFEWDGHAVDDVPRLIQEGQKWRPDYGAYLNSPEWRKRRNDALRRDGFRCQRCSATRRLQVHHLTYVRVGHEDPDDLVTLCARCHKHVDPPR